MSASTLRRRWLAGSRSTPWLPVWSRAAALRGVRAAIVIPSLFAITDQVIGNLQMALFAAFGGFATLVLAEFGGSRVDKLTAHTVLAVVGSVLLTIGTAVNSSVPLAAAATVVVVFVVVFAGVAGPNAASGATAALLAYVLPAASPGTISMVPDRLAGWWLASIAGTVAVLALSPPRPGDGLRAAASKLATALADEIEAVLRGEATDAQLAACLDAKNELLTQFTATGFRPTGLATSDQAMANGVELLEWCAALVVDGVHERDDLSGADPSERELLTTAAGALRAAGLLLAGGDGHPDLDGLEERRRHSMARLHDLTPNGDGYQVELRTAFHADAIAVSVFAIAASALVVAGKVDAAWVRGERTRLFGAITLGADGRLAWLSRYGGIAWRHASLRSIWFVNSLRAALALAAAVTVADLTTVQHGFWVVLGALSVLRTNAAATGSTAVRALLGTAIGFAVGAALLLILGTASVVLWVSLPIAVFVAAYAPGTAPFALGQAAFTVTVVVLFNLLVPVGWKVGVLRVEDVALGCAVSILAGILFWPRGVSAVVGDDLADAYRSGASYLTQAIDWVSGRRAREAAAAGPAVTAGLRLDDALRGYLAEQGSKRIRKEELWRLVGGTMRLRLTARSIAGLPRDDGPDIDETRAVLGRRVEVLDQWYERLAVQVGRPHGQPVATLEAPSADGERRPTSLSEHAIWISEYLDHLTDHLAELVGPADHLAEVRRRPWWR